MSLKFIIFTVLFLLILQYPSYASNNIVLTVNESKVYEDEFNRLFNARKKSYRESLNFNLFSYDSAEIREKRKAYLNKAKKENIQIEDSDVEVAFDRLKKQFKNIDNVLHVASKHDLSIKDIKNKLKENLTLERYFNKIAKSEVIDLLVTEKLLVEESDKRGILVYEKEVISEIEKLKKEKGGLDGFLKYLNANNATITDAKREIKNKLVFAKVKRDIIKNVPISTEEIQKNYEKYYKKDHIPLEEVKYDIAKKIKIAKGEKVFNLYLSKLKSSASVIVYNKYLNNYTVSQKNR